MRILPDDFLKDQARVARFQREAQTLAALNLGTGNMYDVAADGQRFLVNVLAGEQAAPQPITVITNWTATLR